MLPPGVLHMSALGCFGRFTFSHLAFHIPTLAGSCLCLFCVVVWSCCFVFVFLVPVLQVSRNPEFSAQFRPR